MRGTKTDRLSRIFGNTTADLFFLLILLHLWYYKSQFPFNRPLFCCSILTGLTIGYPMVDLYGNCDESCYCFQFGIKSDKSDGVIIPVSEPTAA